MATNPDLFRHMSISEIAATIVQDEAVEMRSRAAQAGARCVDCLDSGMTRAGSFCGCRHGVRLAQQARRT